MRERRQDWEAFKGILICLIVLGHNYHASDYFPWLFRLIYNFHVACFLLFPFLLPAPQRGNLGDRMFRILAPHLVFLTMALLAYWFLFLRTDMQAFGSWLDALPIALLLQNAHWFRETTGFNFFWFLPALAALQLIRFGTSLAARSTMIVVLAALLIWHCTYGLMPAFIFPLMPWSIGMVLYLFIPGLFGARLCNRIRWTGAADLGLILLWLVVLSTIVSLEFYSPLAAGARPNSIAKLPGLLFSDLILISSFLALLRLAYYSRNSFFTKLGGNSLQVFLIHPFLWQAYWLAGGREIAAGSVTQQILLVVLTFALTVLISFAISRVIAKTRLQQILFPQSWREWTSAFRVRAGADK